MGKFSNVNVRPRPPQSPLAAAEPALTYNRGTGAKKDPKTALFSLAVTNMVGEATFYEAGPDRDNRFVALVHDVALSDPAWLAEFIPWLRNVGNMRSAAVVAAAEFVKARLDAGKSQFATDSFPAPLPNGVALRQVVDSACVRADEPAEMIGYWLATHGRRIPKPVKRGVADAATRLYTERNLLKYDGSGKGIRFGDVIDLTHPKPSGPWQECLFRHALDRRHNRGDAKSNLGGTAEARHHGEFVPDLPMLRAAYRLDDLPKDQRRSALDPVTLSAAGYTWERLAGWLPGGMDAQAWETIIPSMGYMALVRNLRNFDEARIGNAAVRMVQDKLSDPDEIAKSRQFPYRFWSAWRATGSMRWGDALETAMDASCANVPRFRGRTLVLVDTSGSMRMPLSGRSETRMYEAAALFGAAVSRENDVRLVLYADTWKAISPKPSVLRTVEEIGSRIGEVGSGTNTWQCAVDAYEKLGPFDRIIVFTDEQSNPHEAETAGVAGFYRDPNGRYHGADGTRYSRGQLPPVRLPNVPIYSWNLAGYGVSHLNTSVPNRYLLAGFSDASFRIVSLLEAGRDGRWPWET